MRRNQRAVRLAGLVALTVLLGTANAANAQERPPVRPSERPLIQIPQTKDPAARGPIPTAYRCKGPITQVSDIAYEDVKITHAIFGMSPGGGAGGQFDPTPVLTTTVTLVNGSCVDAHLSVMVGSKQTYNVYFPISPMAAFQVTLTRNVSGALPQPFKGHYPTPFAVPSPAVLLEAEHDVDMFAANFFQSVGTGPQDVPPGNYTVNVWWAGAPSFAGPGGAIGVAFVLKLYLR
jgi:hypothetical protein